MNDINFNAPGLMRKLRLLGGQKKREPKPPPPPKPLKGRWTQIGPRTFQREDGALVVEFPLGWRRDEYPAIPVAALDAIERSDRVNQCAWTLISPKGVVPMKRGPVGNTPGSMRNGVGGPLARRTVKSRAVYFASEQRAMKYCDELYPPAIGYRGHGFEYPFRDMTEEQIQSRKKVLEKLKYGRYNRF